MQLHFLHVLVVSRSKAGSKFELSIIKTNVLALLFSQRLTDLALAASVRFICLSTQVRT